MHSWQLKFWWLSLMGDKNIIQFQICIFIHFPFHAENCTFNALLASETLSFHHWCAIFLQHNLIPHFSSVKKRQYNGKGSAELIAVGTPAKHLSVSVVVSQHKWLLTFQNKSDSGRRASLWPWIKAVFARGRPSVARSLPLCRAAFAAALFKEIHE